MSNVMEMQMDSYEFARVFRAGLRARQLERREFRAYMLGSVVTAAVMMIAFLIALVLA